MNLTFKIIPFHLVFLLVWVGHTSGQIINSQSIFNYPQNAFDSDTCCWRSLSALGKHMEGAKLILGYLKKSKKVQNKESLQWHAGQLFAKGGDYKSAKKYFKKTYSIFYKWVGAEDGQSWYYFAKGNVAFIDRDLFELKRIMKLWEQNYPIDKNYFALKDLYEYWNSPYGYASTKTP